MTEREELLKDIEETKKRLNTDKLKLEELKKKAQPLTETYKRDTERAVSWLEDLQNDPKSLVRIMSELETVKNTQTELMEILEAIEELEGEKGSIQLHEDDIENYQDELKHVKAAYSEYLKVLALQLMAQKADVA